MKIQEMFELHDRVAIITGGGTHLGRAMATALGELGAATVIASAAKPYVNRLQRSYKKQASNASDLAAMLLTKHRSTHLWKMWSKCTGGWT